MNGDYTLCVLVPCFNYSAGVCRILELVASDPRIVVILGDDSTDSSCKNEILDFIARLGTSRIIYCDGPGRGAVKNWNFLLSKVNASYYVLVHHDETFSDLAFLDVLDENVLVNSVFILPVKVFDKNNCERVISSYTQRFMLSFFSAFLPFFNFLGPSAVLVIRSDIRIPFNQSLNWFVDAEWYYRVLSAGVSKWSFVTKGSHVESYAYSESITNLEYESSREISSRERQFLVDHGHKSAVYHWRIYGFILAKMAFYCVGFRSYFRYLACKIRANRSKFFK